MASQRSTPFFDNVQQLVALKGAPRISYPWGDTDYPRTERYYEHKRGSQLALGDPEPDNLRFPLNTLTELQETGGDAQFAKMVYRWDRLPGKIISSLRLGEQGGLETSTTQLIGTGTVTPEGGVLVLADNVNAQNAILSTQEIRTIDEWPTLTEYLRDPETRSLITITYKVVNAAEVAAVVALDDATYAEAYATSTPGVSREFRRMDEWRSLRVITTYSVPATYAEQRFMGFRFESMFYSFLHIDGCGTYIGMIEGRTTNVACVTVISFGAYEVVTGQKIFTNSFRLFDFNLQDILNDAGCYQSTGSCVTAGTGINVPASYPTATEYEALFDDTFRLITGESVLWHNELFRTSKLYVQFPTLPATDPGSCA